MRRSLIAWLSEVYDCAQRNAFVRLSEKERLKVGIMTMWLFLGVVAFFMILNWLR